MNIEIIAIIIIVLFIIFIALLIISLVSLTDKISTNHRSGIISSTTFISSILIGAIVLVYGFTNVQNGTWNFSRLQDEIGDDEINIVSNGMIYSYRGQSDTILKILQSNGIEPNSYRSY